MRFPLLCGARQANYRHQPDRGPRADWNTREWPHLGRGG